MILSSWFEKVIRPPTQIDPLNKAGSCLGIVWIREWLSELSLPFDFTRQFNSYPNTLLCMTWTTFSSLCQLQRSHGQSLRWKCTCSHRKVNFITNNPYHGLSNWNQFEFLVRDDSIKLSSSAFKIFPHGYFSTMSTNDFTSKASIDFFGSSMIRRDNTSNQCLESSREMVSLNNQSARFILCLT